MNLLNLNTKFVGRNCIYHEIIDSTQKEAWRQVSNRVENGTLIFADEQKNGMGTHGRKWYTTEKESIAMSIVIYPKCNIKNLNNITIDIAEVLINVFRKLYSIELDIKKPNDIICNGKKLGGILTETKVFGEIVNTLVIGIGLNLNQEIFKDEISNIATSIKKEFGFEVDRIKVISEICNLLEEILIRL